MAGESRSKDVGFKVFKEFEADWVFSRTLEFMNEKCAEIGECLSTARRIDQKSNESWHTEWAALARHVVTQSCLLLASGHRWHDTPTPDRGNQVMFDWLDAVFEHYYSFIQREGGAR